MKLFKMNAILFGAFFSLFASNAYAQWQWSSPKNAPITINDVIWGNGVFVAVGRDGGVRLSSNAQDWSDYSTPTQYPLNGIAWNGLQYVAVGGIDTIGERGRVVLTSADAKNWVMSQKTADAPLNAIATNGSEFVAVGPNAIMSSVDGENWSKLTPVSGNFKDIIWADTRFIAVGEAGKIMTSTDGDSWSDVSVATLGGLNSIAWDGSLYVVAGDEGRVYTSTDLADWASSDVTGAGFTNINVLWSKATSKFFMLTAGSSAKLSVSSDGREWAEGILGVRTMPFFNAIAENTSAVVAAGINGFTYVLGVNSNGGGSSWTPNIRPLASQADFKSIIWGNDRYVAVGLNGVTGAVWASDDQLISWTKDKNSFPVPIVDIAYSGTLFVTVSGVKNASAKTYTSTDLVGWTLNTSANVQSMNGIVWDGTQFIGVGYGNNIATSSDGVTWEQVDLSTVSIANVDFNNVYYDGKILVALGRESTSSGVILTSTDNGQNWVKQTSNTTAGLYDVVGNGTVYVAVGGSVSTQVILTSPDLVNWTERDSGTSGELRSIVWNGKQFIAPIGEVDASQARLNLTGGVITSEDGESWLFESIPGASALYSVVEKDEQVVVVGDDSNILRKGNRIINGVINDTVAPVVIPPADIVIDAGRGANAIIIYSSHPVIAAFLNAVSATDNGSVFDANDITNNAPFEFMSSAETRVIFTAIDDAGNVGEASAYVRIRNGKQNEIGVSVGGIVGDLRGSGGEKGGALGIGFLLLLCLPFLFRSRPRVNTL